MRTRRSLVKIGERFHVKGYIPPAALSDIAEDRTIGFQAAFVHFGARARDLGAFARSCYMQGINDATDAITKTCKPLEPK